MNTLSVAHTMCSVHWIITLNLAAVPPVTLDLQDDTGRRECWRKSILTASLQEFTHYVHPSHWPEIVPTYMQRRLGVLRSTWAIWWKPAVSRSPIIYPWLTPYKAGNKMNVKIFLEMLSQLHLRNFFTFPGPHLLPSLIRILLSSF